jgi:hypothetical protein
MSKPEYNYLDSAWLMAAVFGGLWATVKIINRRFFQNLCIPFTGSGRAMNGTILMGCHLPDLVSKRNYLASWVNLCPYEIHVSQCYYLRSCYRDYE